MITFAPTIITVSDYMVTQVSSPVLSAETYLSVRHESDAYRV